MKTTFSVLYENDLVYQNKRYNQLAHNFSLNFGDANFRFFSSPGRTELGGNHTDHNHGMVIAASINLDSIACVSKSDSVVEIYSEGYERPFSVNLENLTLVESEFGTTNSLIRGIASALFNKGYKIGGFRACVSSNVIKGSGLSSSASIEVLIGTIFNHLYNDGDVPVIEIAKVSQFAEDVYFKKPCGLMDQIACGVGGIVSIDFSNSANPGIDKINFDFSKQNYALVFIHTGGSHTNLTNDYASIPAEMRIVANELGEKFLRETEYKDFLSKLNTLRGKFSDRSILRSYHFYKENERVKKQIQAFNRNKFDIFLSLVNESGNSSFKYLQNIYSTEEINSQPLSIALAFAENFIESIGEGACRVHGGGFEGTIQVFIPTKKVGDFKKYFQRILKNFRIFALSIRTTGATEVIFD